MNETPVSDLQVIRSLLAGSGDAFSAIYERYSANIYRFALQLTADAEAAQDVTQETFLFLMRSAASYDVAKGSLLSWLLGVVRNLARRRAGLAREDASVLDEEPAGGSDTFSTLTRIETIQSVRDAIETLPPSYREVIALCELQELDYSEAAIVLGCPVGTVRSRLHRARRLLSSKLRSFSYV